MIDDGVDATVLAYMLPGFDGQGLPFRHHAGAEQAVVDTSLDLHGPLAGMDAGAKTVAEISGLRLRVCWNEKEWQ